MLFSRVHNHVYCVCPDTGDTQLVEIGALDTEAKPLSLLEARRVKVAMCVGLAHRGVLLLHALGGSVVQMLWHTPGDVSSEWGVSELRLPRQLRAIPPEAASDLDYA